MIWKNFKLMIGVLISLNFNVCFLVVFEVLVIINTADGKALLLNTCTIL